MSKLSLTSAVFALFLQSLMVAQSPIEVRVKSTQLTPGSSVPFRVVMPNCKDGRCLDVHLVVGTTTQASVLGLSGQGITIPIGGLTSVVFSQNTNLRQVTGTFQIPNDPSLVGLDLNVAAVGIRGLEVLTSYATPIGPIVEEIIL